MIKEREHHLIVAIGRLKGSGGTYLGRELAGRLGCAYLDREILLEAARRLNGDPEALEALDERKLSFWERIRLEAARGVPTPAYVPPPLNQEDSKLYETEKAIILEAVERGPAVVVGRAAFHFLAEEPGLLSVFLHAPFERRVERVMRVYGMTDREEAEGVVKDSDRHREGFVKSVTGRDWLDPRNFHLSLDTWKLGPTVALGVIERSALSVREAMAARAGAMT
jgi:CMP/dCMP kinase